MQCKMAATRCMLALLLIGTLVSVGVPLIQQAEAQSLNVTFWFNSNPCCQDKSNGITLSISNPNPNQVFITGASIKFEWRQTPYTWSGNTGITTGNKGTVFIPFDVPKNAMASKQTYQIIISYSYEGSSDSWTGGGSDFEVKYCESTDYMVIAIVIIAVIALIVAIIVAYLYIKKKPVVQVRQEIRQEVVEPESPPTRIKLPGSGGGPSDTRVSGYAAPSSATAVVRGPAVVPQTAVVGGGASITMPNGQTKAFGNEIILGRADFEGMISQELQAKISRNHCKIWSSKGAYYLEDGYMGQPSTNSTFLNGKDIAGKGPQSLKDGDTIKLATAAEVKVKLSGDASRTVIGGATSSTTMKTTVQPQAELYWEDKKTTWPITGEFVLGREHFRGKLPDDRLNRISAKHCRIFTERSTLYIEDGYQGVPSTNGTKLNGLDIRGLGKSQLKKGDMIAVGDVATLEVR